MCTLISKYNVPGPRYTSYPTVPYWDEGSFDVEDHLHTSFQSFKESNAAQGISLYIHLPFCESMCTFCGCTKRITKNHNVEVPYIEAVLKELAMYTSWFQERPKVSQLHLGGGTPTFFSPENLDVLINGVFALTQKMEDCELSFEGHPNNTTKAHLKTLFELGFRRVCYGVQDYNEKVQMAIRRVQPFSRVQQATTASRELGYTSVGHDIIYGLPYQTLEHVRNTIEKTLQLRPDRIAFYSYAHVPWVKGNGQRGFKEENLPSSEEKRKQYQLGKALLLEAGYVEVGMDHFALPEDTLATAKASGCLHRNFMGYTPKHTQMMIGLGVSAISDSWYSFAQNVKTVEEYLQLIEQNTFPIFRGHLLTHEDLVVRKHILNLMCAFETTWETQSAYFAALPEVLSKLDELSLDGLIQVSSKRLKVTEKGKPFVRNICIPFDLRLQRKKPDTQLFSMTV